MDTTTKELPMPHFDACAHEPNAAGTGCRFCGLAAERVTPDATADSLIYALLATGRYEHSEICDGSCGCGEGPA